MVAPSWNHVFLHVQATHGAVSHMVFPSWNHLFVSNMLVPSWNHAGFALFKEVPSEGLVVVSFRFGSDSLPDPLVPLRN